ncbi:MAG TPA: hypothetical protein VHU84_18525 [Lacipirellulaceae bacterium]|nr:hypothetical protein [Lacipirellulaceae bacterium]
MSQVKARWRKVWGGASAVLDRAQRFSWVVLFIAIAIAGVLYGVLDVAREWTAPQRPDFKIDLSIRALPEYTFFSLCRGLIAYAFSLSFTLVYGYWAAKDKLAARVLEPLTFLRSGVPAV